MLYLDFLYTLLPDLVIDLIQNQHNLKMTLS